MLRTCKGASQLRRDPAQQSGDRQNFLDRMAKLKERGDTGSFQGLTDRPGAVDNLDAASPASKPAAQPHQQADGQTRNRREIREVEHGKTGTAGAEPGTRGP